MRRVVAMELLDALPAADLRAAAARADLRRLNGLMGHAGILTRAFQEHFARALAPGQPLRVVELGAGDGSLALALARRWSKAGFTGEMTLLDQQNLLLPATVRAFSAAGWSVNAVTSDVFDWLEKKPPEADVMFANLFLHHFDGNRLGALLRLVAARTRVFLACEPRRAPVVLLAARLLGLIGCHAVTRHDAVVSVRAGFADRELSALWPEGGIWKLDERPAGLFSQCFRAGPHG